MRLAFAAVPLVLASFLAVACGGATNADLGEDHDGGADAASADGASDDAACVQPVEGQACSPTTPACARDGNACCIGYIWQCDGSTHKWVKLGLGCACPPPAPDAGGDALVTNDGGPWACGTSTCGATQYCEDHPPGIRLPDGGVPPDAYTCAALPSACRANPTCACVKAAVGNGSGCMVTSCDESNGHVELHCIGL